MSRKKMLTFVLIFFVMGLALLSIHYYNKYQSYKEADNYAYRLSVDGIISNGVAEPLYKTSKALELINQNSPEMKTGVETWLFETTSNLSVAEKSAQIAMGHLNISLKDKDIEDILELSHFFGDIKISLLDILHTENDFEQWKQACIELNDIMAFLDQNLNEAVLSRGNYSEVQQHWKQLMNQIYEKHANSRLLKWRS
jgi:hypothetical protein